MIELWKIHKFCETATLEQLLDSKRELQDLMDSGKLPRARCDYFLSIIEESIALRKLFKED
jgi:hypothetical protein